MNTALKHCHWDIFCTVIDNYGDIGVCWRLARQLVSEHQISVRLWVDHLEALQQLCPATAIVPCQLVEGVEIRQWLADTDFSKETCAQIVVEAFACDIPNAYLSSMQALSKPPVWINLEYLTAESWALGCHKLPSIEPQSGLTKYFYFPGFTKNSGGLLRENKLLEQRDDWINGNQKTAFISRYGINLSKDSLLVSLFCYENLALPSLLSAMALGQRAIHLLVPHGRISKQVEAYIAAPLLPGIPHCHGSLTVQAMPFIPQIEYDQLLWLCDINLVRGEDSLVRALWSGKPLLWHLYPQQNEDWLPKMQAFLDLYCNGLDNRQTEILSTLWSQWNRGQNITEIWALFMTKLDVFSCHGEKWCNKQKIQGHLTANLVHFCTELI
jgi:uncharacterized repeat protein (TIGR03837 family)